MFLLLLLAPAATAAPTDDLDADGVPDAVESQLCGRAAVRDLINQPDVPGSCPTTADFDATEVAAAVDQAWEDANEAVDKVAVAVGGAFELVDADSDFIPDATEAAICQVEDQNDPQDGVCNGDDYNVGRGLGQCDASLPLFLCVDDQPGPITRRLGLPFGVHYVGPDGSYGNL